jgi:membrane fusion protein, multidrug efflux system
MMLADGTSLYVVDEAKTATRRKVKALHTFGTKVAVSGVEPGEQVVIEGSQNVRPGGKVRIDVKAPAAAPGAPESPAKGTTGVTPGSAASSDGTDIKPPRQERA